MWPFGSNKQVEEEDDKPLKVERFTEEDRVIGKGKYKTIESTLHLDNEINGETEIRVRYVDTTSDGPFIQYHANYEEPEKRRRVTSIDYSNYDHSVRRGLSGPFLRVHQDNLNAEDIHSIEAYEWEATGKVEVVRRNYDTMSSSEWVPEVHDWEWEEEKTEVYSP